MRFLKDTYADPQGIPKETVLSASGALAGFAVQEAIWEGAVRTGMLTVAQAFICTGTDSGETYFFGMAPTELLLSMHPERISVWRVVAGGLRKSGLHALPDLQPICEQSLKTLGTPAYGIPIQTKREFFEELPRDALRNWPRIHAILGETGVQPLHWPVAIAMAARDFIYEWRDDVPPAIATVIVMEAAISMSRVDPRTVPGGTVVGRIADKVTDLPDSVRAELMAQLRR